MKRIVQRMSDGTSRFKQMDAKQMDAKVKNGVISIKWSIDKGTNNKGEEEFTPYINNSNSGMGTSKTEQNAFLRLKKYAKNKYGVVI